MDNSNKAHDIPREVKNNIKLMEMEQGLHVKVVKLRRKDLKFVATDRNTNEAKFKFQGLSERSQRWFDIDLDWIEVIFSSCEPDFYKKLLKAMKIHNIIIHSDSFKFQFGNAKCVESFKFQNDAPILKYCHNLL